MAQSPNLKVHIRQLGGAVAAKAGNDAVGKRREAGYVLYLLGALMGPNTPEAIHEHAENVFASLGDLVMCRGPLNWLGEGKVSSDAVRGVFEDEDWARLLGVKQAVDPTNVFSHASVGLATA